MVAGTLRVPSAKSVLTRRSPSPPLKGGRSHELAAAHIFFDPNELVSNGLDFKDICSGSRVDFR